MDLESLTEGEFITIRFDRPKHVRKQLGTSSTDELEVKVKTINEDNVVLQDFEFEQRTTVEKDSDYEGRLLKYYNQRDELITYPKNDGTNIASIVGKNVERID